MDLLFFHSFSQQKSKYQLYARDHPRQDNDIAKTLLTNSKLKLTGLIIFRKISFLSLEALLFTHTHTQVRSWKIIKKKAHGLLYSDANPI